MCEGLNFIILMELPCIIKTNEALDPIRQIRVLQIFGGDVTLSESFTSILCLHFLSIWGFFKNLEVGGYPRQLVIHFYQPILFKLALSNKTMPCYSAHFWQIINYMNNLVSLKHSATF